MGMEGVSIFFGEFVEGVIDVVMLEVFNKSSSFLDEDMGIW